MRVSLQVLSSAQLGSCKIAWTRSTEPGKFTVNVSVCVCLYWSLAILVLHYVPMHWTDEAIISGICVRDRKISLPSAESVAVLRVSFSRLVLCLWGCSCGHCRGSVWGSSWDAGIKQRCWGRECRWSDQGTEWNTGRWVSKSQVGKQSTSSILL